MGCRLRMAVSVSARGGQCGIATPEVRGPLSPQSPTKPSQGFLCRFGVDLTEAGSCEEARLNSFFNSTGFGGGKEFDPVSKPARSAIDESNRGVAATN